MHLEQLSKEITLAMQAQVQTLHEERAAQRERWFETDDQGRKVEVYETYIVGGQERKFSRIGLESPDKFTISKITVETNSDIKTEEGEKGLKKLVCNMHGHTDSTSEVKVVVEFERSDASEGMLALHQRAVREIKQACLEFTPESPGSE